MAGSRSLGKPTRALGSCLVGSLDVRIAGHEAHLGGGRLGVGHQPLLEVRVRPGVRNQAWPQRLLPKRVHVLRQDIPLPDKEAYNTTQA